jgi:NADH:ubiquinone oxidoreductase subunit 5 (subunit L)/multisubunit Na+/H+ antiporter MnhA subunit
LKRVLAYSSVENIGLVLIGLGLGYWGAAANLPAVAALGALAAGFHLWSHVLMKGLLFLCAGSVLHGVGTRDLEQMGGLARRMPVTAALTIFGAVAIAGLPPLNGFVGEWLLMRGLFASGVASHGAGGVAALLAVGALAFVGALAALAFVRMAGIALLGNPRSEAAAHAHESSAGMLAPILGLAAGCAALSLHPALALRPVAAFAGQVFGAPVAAGVLSLAPSLGSLGAIAAGLTATALFAAALLLSRLQRLPMKAAAPPTWDCGYAAPTPRMQYTARSFSELATALILPRALAPRTKAARPVGLFPSAGTLGTEEADPLTRGWYEPLFTRVADRFTGLRWLQQGELHAYLFYILAVVVAALTWVSLRGWTVP